MTHIESTTLRIETGGGWARGAEMSDWQESVEQRLDQLHGDTRSLLWAMMGGFVLTWSGLIAGFLLLSDKIDRYFLQFVDKLAS